MLLTPSIATNWGSTPDERALALPCDRQLSGTRDAYHRAITIEAPAPTVFRWLCQLRVAPYSYDWIDNFGRRSPQELTPGLDDLAFGQRFMTVFDLVDFERDRHITLRLRRGRSSFGDLVVTYAVLPLDERRCRLLVRLLVRRSGIWPVALVRRVLLPWGDVVMMRRQLLNLRQLAETTARADAQRGGD
jgi:hypothetical protein